MKILNVVEVVDGSITQIISFPMENDERVAEAENLFKAIALEIGAKEEDLNSFVEDGFYSASFQDSVNLSWSDVK